MQDIKNKVLKRQLKKSKINSFENLNEESFNKLISLVEETYEDMDNNSYRLERAIDISTSELKDLNENLELKVKQEIKKNKEKEEKLFSQAKLASMGDMIANIAHQWRQPLSFISMNASGIKLKQELGLLKEEELNSNMDEIIDKTIYLSETIDTFRNFLKDEKEYKDIVLQDSINFALDIVSHSLNNNYIKLINNIDNTKPIKVRAISLELSEVVINILNNARDVLLERKIENACVTMDLELFENKVVISIEDNAGGVKEDIIDRIFEPYFTTKHKHQGTGLGLNMSYKIVTESLGGSLIVKNSDVGAKFFIELPLK